MRLNVGVFRSEKFFCAVSCEIFDFVHEFATAVITLAGVAFGVFVCRNPARRKQNGFAYDIFGRDKFDSVSLAVKFSFRGGCDIRIVIFKFFEKVHV